MILVKWGLYLCLSALTIAVLGAEAWLGWLAIATVLFTIGAGMFIWGAVSEMFDGAVELFGNSQQPPQHHCCEHHTHHYHDHRSQHVTVQDPKRGILSHPRKHD